MTQAIAIGVGVLLAIVGVFGCIWKFKDAMTMYGRPHPKRSSNETEPSTTQE